MKWNVLADSLSHLDFKRFFKNAHETINKTATEMPAEIWPMEKIWVTGN